MSSQYIVVNMRLDVAEKVAELLANTDDPGLQGFATEIRTSVEHQKKRNERYDKRREAIEAKERKTRDCPWCEGVGSITEHDQTKRACPECCGKGEICV